MRTADRIFYGICAALAIIATAYLILVPEVKAADESPFKDPNCPTVEEVILLLTKQGENPVILVLLLTKQGENPVILDIQSILGVATEAGSGRIVLSTFGGREYVVFGFEQGGCLQGPTPVAHVLPEHPL